ncbi:hypothetical protein ASE86_15485 [Sphingomonas sp. Leaf33]|uniref:DedA family protein n=1 Tax=Sphingomonas sp. Leaf33 TaxID=1736215 RepID=UPI0006F6853A|nr:VTT domain-containing protein [Sphingomonas sp. Leaf33]KQN20644.1 hypothetical protein ASE86_15485 [Sphingomonas sp. Leaf33]
MTLEAIVARYGLLAIFVGAGVEGETVVAGGGLLANQGMLPLAGVMVAAAAGSALADGLFFAIGRRFRDHRRVKRIREKPAFARALALLERYPTGFIFAFRFLYGLRTVSPMAIGTMRVPTRRFLALNAAAAVVWAVLISTIGYLFGRALATAVGRLHSVEHVALAIGGVVVIAGGIAWLVCRYVSAKS